MICLNVTSSTNLTKMNRIATKIAQSFTPYSNND